MVLILSFLLSFFSSDLLLDKYTKTVKKQIKKNLSLQSYHLDEMEFEAGELYCIKENDIVMGYLMISEVAACNLGGCPTYKAVEQDVSSEYFDMMAILDTESKIVSLKILDYFSDYGYEITSRKYLKKFRGYKVCTISKEKDKVDAISGATISSYALEGMLGQLCGYL